MASVKYIIFLLVCCLSHELVESQVSSGYFGKQFSVGGGFRHFFMTRLYNTNIPSSTIMSNTAVPVRSIPYISIGYSIKTRTELFIDAEYIRTRQLITNMVDIEGILWGAGIRKFEKSHGSISPVGYYGLGGLYILSKKISGDKRNSAGILAGFGTQYIGWNNLIISLEYKGWFPVELLILPSGINYNQIKFTRDVSVSSLLSINTGVRWLLK